MTESDYSPFLKSFGRTLKPSSIKPNEITEGSYILDELSKINRELANLKSLTIQSNLRGENYTKKILDLYKVVSPRDSMGLILDKS